MSIEKIELDLGASGSRLCQKKGIVDTLPNNMVFLDMDTKIDLVPYSGSIHDSLEAFIYREGSEVNSAFPCHVLIGSMAERYLPANERPNVGSNKLDQKVNYVSAIIAATFLKLKHDGGDEVQMYLALPPVEVKQGKETANQLLCGKYRVELPKFNGGQVVEFEVKEVRCYAESYLALMSFVFTSEGKIREENKFCREGYTLSVDIGASTSDLAMMKDGRYLEKTGKTYKVGGNIAREYLTDRVREMYGYDLPVEEAEVVMKEGRIRVGATYQIITEVIEEAKRHLAQAICEQIMAYFRQINIPIQMVSNIVVSGGGSLESSYADESGQIVKTSNPAAMYLTDYVHNICEQVNVVYYGSNSRLANITGLFIQASVDEMMEKQNKAVYYN